MTDLRLERGRRLKAAMKAAGLSNQEVAEVAGVDPVTVSQWRTGKQWPSDEKLERVAAALGTTVTALRYGDESERSSSRGSAVSEAYPASPREIHGIPKDLRIAAAEFELEAVKSGADEHAITFIRHVLSGEPSAVMYMGGYKEPTSPENAKIRQDALIVGLRMWLEEYMKLNKGGRGP